MKTDRVMFLQVSPPVQAAIVTHLAKLRTDQFSSSQCGMGPSTRSSGISESQPFEVRKAIVELVASPTMAWLLRSSV